MVNSGEEETGEKEEERVEVKTVKYRELIQQAERREEDSRDVRSGESEWEMVMFVFRLHHLMVIQPPPPSYLQGSPNGKPETGESLTTVAPSRAWWRGLCPPEGRPAEVVTYSVILVTLWAVSYCVLGQVALPGHQHIHVTIEGGTLFSLLVMFVVSYLAGCCVQLLYLPPLLGMLLTGVLLRNVPYIDVAKVKTVKARR